MNKKDFFISYNIHDKKWAEWIAWHLEDKGYSTIIQAWDFGSGNWVLSMNMAMKEANKTIAVLSKNYLEAKYTQSEWANAFLLDPTGEKDLLIPIRVEECKIEGSLSQIVYLDFIGIKENKAIELLMNRVNGKRNKPDFPPIFPDTTQSLILKSNIEKPDFPTTSNSSSKEQIEKQFKISYYCDGIGEDFFHFIETHNIKIDEIKSISFNNNNGWVVLFKNGGYGFANIPSDLANILKGNVDSKSVFEQFLFLQDGGWLLISDKGKKLDWNSSSSITNYLAKKHEIGKYIARVYSFPRNGWLLFFNDGTIYYENLQPEIGEYIDELIDNGVLINDIVVAKNYGNIIISENDCFFTQNLLPINLVKKLMRFKELKREIEYITISPTNGWIIIFKMPVN